LEIASWARGHDGTQRGAELVEGAAAKR
jgi:hypothetical protein